MAISLEYLKIFYIVAKFGKIAIASEELYISQPAITQTIKKLEEQLGANLFVRTKKGMELTYEGKGLYDYIESSMKILLNSENFFSNYNHLENGKIKIGGGRSFLDIFIMPVCEKFMSLYPSVNIALLDVDRNERIKQVLNGDLNIAIVENLEKDFNEKYANLEAIKINEDDKYMFIASLEYSKEHNVENINDMNSLPLIIPSSEILSDICNRELEKNDVKISCEYEVYSSERFYKMVDQGKGIGFTNNIYQKFRTKTLDKKYKVIKEVKDYKTYEYVITLKKEFRSKATNEFLKLIKESLNKEN